MPTTGKHISKELIAFGNAGDGMAQDIHTAVGIRVVDHGNTTPACLDAVDVGIGANNKSTRIKPAIGTRHVEQGYAKWTEMISQPGHQRVAAGVSEP